jgi:hypothetical protein
LLRDFAGRQRTQRSAGSGDRHPERWNRRSDTASVAMTLFDRWQER